MGDIIDLTKKLKENELHEFFRRTIECSQNEKMFGSCKCDLCNLKVQIANQLMNISKDIAVDIMKSGGTTLYYGDLLECFCIATLKMANLCKTEFTNDKK